METDRLRLTGDDIYLFNEGSHCHLYRLLGAHPGTQDGARGTHFAVWAPNARDVSVTGDFNAWQSGAHPLQALASSGIWHGFLPGVAEGALYKYHIHSEHQDYHVDKADPFAFRSQTAPATASIVWGLEHSWGDSKWLAERGRRQAASAPFAIYEMHLGSWDRVWQENNRFLSYRELAERLPAYIKSLGFTHVEFLPLMEHPFYGSWGYQTTGYFAASSRWGTPQDLMYLIDQLHQHEIGVILDWVPSHFPSDEHGLSYFDGTALFEHEDKRLGFHPDWNSLIFNYGRNEVRSFLVSSALFWLDVYHIDALRVDAVASMLYLDYSRKAGEWLPNKYGGRENLEAIGFLKQLNEAIYRFFPDVQTIAEESTAWPMVSRPTYLGGLGFSMKWDMGWMHDTLSYFSSDPLFRRYQHSAITFRIMYAYTENFALTLSHDEVVYGKGSLINKMPGDLWQKFANLRLLYAYLYAMPGKKLLFMGAEFAQFREWNHEASLDWGLCQDERHRGVMALLQDLNRLYRHEKALHELDFDPRGFEWIDHADVENSVFSFVRKGLDEGVLVLAVFNMTPIPRFNYGIGVPAEGLWQEILNSDSHLYGGSGHGNFGGLEAAPVPLHGRPMSLSLTLPPLGALFLRHVHAKGWSDEA